MPFAVTDPSLKLAVTALVCPCIGWPHGMGTRERALTRHCAPFDATVLQSTQMRGLSHPCFLRKRPRCPGTPISMLCAAMQYWGSFLFTLQGQCRTSEGVCVIWLLAGNMVSICFLS